MLIRTGAQYDTPQNYDKSVKFRIQQIRGANATLSGIFFDPIKFP
jgi:hypothetical protein